MRRRSVILAASGLLVVGGSTAAVYVHQQLATHNVRGSSSVEFSTGDGPAVDESPPTTARTPTTTTPSVTTPTVTTPPPPPGPPPIPEPWPQYGYDLARTHAAPASYGFRPPFRQVWSQYLGLLEFSPAIAYGSLYVTNGTGELFAVKATNGLVLWSRAYHRCAGSSPAVGNGVVYQGFMGVTCAHTNQQGFVAAFRARDGKELWRVTTPVVESSPLLNGAMLYFGTWGGYVYGVNIHSHGVRWRTSVDADVVAGVVMAHDTLYAATNGGVLYALNPANGRVLWQAASFSQFGNRQYFYATPAVAYGRVYAPNTDGYLYSFGERSGALRWARRVGTYIYTAPAVWRRTVFVATYDGYAVALDAATGDVRWRVALPSAAHGALSVIGGVVYVSVFGVNAAGAARYVKGGPAATLGLDARTGRVVWSSPRGRYTPMIADQTRLYFNSGYMLAALAPAG